MRKVILPLISFITLSFSSQLSATKMPNVITFIGNDDARYVAHREEENFLAAFVYLQFTNELGCTFDNSSTSKYRSQETKHLGVDIKDIEDSIAKIETVLTYDNQINLLEQEIVEASEDENFDIYELNRIIQQFHPVKAFRLKCNILKGLVYAGGVALIAYLAIKNVFMQTKLNRMQEDLLGVQEDLLKQREYTENLKSNLELSEANQALGRAGIMRELRNELNEVRNHMEIEQKRAEAGRLELHSRTDELQESLESSTRVLNDHVARLGADTNGVRGAVVELQNSHTGSSLYNRLRN